MVAFRWTFSTCGMGFSLPGDKAANARPAYRSLRRPRGSALTDVGNHEPHRFEALVRRLLYDFRRPGRKRAGHARAGRARRGMFWKARLCRGGLLQCVSLHPAVSFAKKAVLVPIPNAIADVDRRYRREFGSPNDGRDERVWSAASVFTTCLIASLIPFHRFLIGQ